MMNNMKTTTMQNLTKCTVRLIFMVLITKTIMIITMMREACRTRENQKMRYTKKLFKNLAAISVTDRSSTRRTSIKQLNWTRNFHNSWLT